MSVQTRKVTSEEQYQEALRIRKKVFVEEQNVPMDLEVDENEQVATHVVAYDEKGNVVGTGRIRPYADGVGKMERIAVLPDVREGGVGRSIMNRLEELGRELGFRKFVLEAQVHAQGFYEKLGYVNLSPEPFLEAGIWHVKMEKLA